MPRRHGPTLLLAFALILVISCGGGSKQGPGFSWTTTDGLFPLPPTQPPSPGTSCAVAVTGRIVDTTSSATVKGRVLVAAETGGISPAYSVAHPVTRYLPVTVTTPTFDDGNFAVCLISQPPSQYGVAIVLSAATSDGKLFGPSVVLLPASSIQATVALGDIRVAGDATLPGALPPAPASVTVPITSAPLAVDGSIWALATIPDPANPSQPIELAVPIMTSPLLLRNGAFVFHTAPASNAPFATANANVQLPSQKPWVRNENTRLYSQSAGDPAYRIVAGGTKSGSGSQCVQGWQETATQADGMPLAASPGSSLTVSTLAFTGCN